ncbi:hypothetical protein TorRG33x02_079020 [Trema orientale]|uniref:Uncharacterized protein n=1 Tax=Trema orientale TaxID=63057 RepID=A0A2P5FEU1_TREOI|nr:hypothetical protein TorRG33x02_079020 [Trema orientale]
MVGLPGIISFKIQTLLRQFTITPSSWFDIPFTDAVEVAPPPPSCAVIASLLCLLHVLPLAPALNPTLKTQ